MNPDDPDDEELEVATPELPVRAAPLRAQEPRHGAGMLVQRWFFGSFLAASAAASLAFLMLPPGVPGTPLLWPAGVFVVLTLFSAAGLAVAAQWRRHAMVLMLALATLAVLFTAMAPGWGVAAPALMFLGLFVCLGSLTVSPVAGAALAALSAVGLLGVALATELSAGETRALSEAELLRLAMLLLMVLTGLGVGWTAARVSARYASAADDRERRFRGLLAIAADAYWEIDPQCRLVAVTDPTTGRTLPALESSIGLVPWECQALRCDADTLDLLQADIDSHVPFRDLAIEWQSASGRVHSIRISGEPRFDDRGVLLGYWGVARDVSAEVAARQALQATESRYQELFSRIPTPLVLHREGRVIDANAAGVALFGQPGLQAMLGSDVLAAYDPRESRDRERVRNEELELMPVGEGVPVADFALVVGGRRLTVRATAVRVDTEGGPATLSIYVDDTQRRAAEEAVRRSEAMLSHLVATSPDVITLSELGNGRFAMVNRTFERLTGYSASEVIGRTAIELGIWSEPDDWRRFVAEVRERGAVQEMPCWFTAKSGDAIRMTVSGARFTMDGREFLVINARDVTESDRTRLEREAILENASVGIAVTRDRQFVLANPAFESMYGWAPGTMVGQPVASTWPEAHEYARFVESTAAVLACGESVEHEGPARRRDGSVFLARLTGRAIDRGHPAQAGTLWIVEDVTDRREFERTLARARDEAEAASRAKSAFLANTSHELRTPLNGMIGLAELARAPDLDEDRRRQYLDQIVDSAQSLAGIISDILDLSKIEAGKLGLERTVFSLDELLDTVQRGYAALADARGLALECELDASVAGSVSGDPLRVRQIVSNYLGNALKFTAQGVVRLRARRIAGERVRIEVEDTGTGIDAQTLPRLFQPFTQADESTTRRFGGTGLGLSICRELAHLMGGEVGVQSELGRGSLFWTELPLPRAQAAEPSAEALDAAEAALHGARVLLVEDNPVNMLIASALLERWGVQVAQATDGRQAIEAVERAHAASEPFHLVLMDVQMPVMSGHEASRHLRASTAGQRLPIVALTAAAMVSERDEALASGMDDFLTKPIDPARLRSVLTRWLAAERVG